MVFGLIAAIMGIVAVVVIGAAALYHALTASRQEADQDYSPNPVGSPKGECPLQKSLKGMVTEVTFKSNIKVSYAKATVPTPHWKLGVDVKDGDGSKRPAVYLLENKGGSHDLSVKVKITENKNVSGNGKLIGTLGDLEMEGQCPLSVGEHDVPVKIKKLPASIKWYHDDVSWGLEVADLGQTITLDNPTRLEVFVILDKPAAFYDTVGVWTEALRFLCEKVSVVDETTEAGASAKITTYCHGSHGLNYDTSIGSPVYGCDGTGGTFDLAGYIKKSSGSTVNCYDQAGAIQSLSGALGVKLTWYFLRPFGFIQTTNLVGVGSCNNPFYVSNGTTAVIAVDDPRRTGFGNHAFGGLGGKVHDACAGPHTGSETKSQYVGVAIDATKALYTWVGDDKPGTDSDITEPRGVTGVT